MKYIDWYLAKGSCGFNVGDTPVYGAYVNGVALFDIGACVVVTGHCSTSSRSSAVKIASEDGYKDADRRYSLKQFRAKMEDATRLSI